MKPVTFIFLFFALIGAASEERPNVLFIAVDDWNDWVGCLGHKQAITPHVDRLAERGMLFTNASTAASVCNPSRAAVMSGLRPWTSGVYENATPLQTQLREDQLTLPRYFRQHGYIAHGSGKLYHDQIGGHPHDDFDHYHFWHELYRDWGWELGYSRFPDPQPDKRPFAKITAKTKRNFDFGPIGGEESEMPDFKSTSYGVEFLGKSHDAPFFLAIGQFKPHLPWFVPQKYLDLYPLDKIKLPEVREDDIDDLPDIAKQRAVDRSSRHDLVVKLDEWKAAVQGYLGCISFSDAQVGRLIDALDQSAHRDKTIIVLWSDHGYHLGEKGHWHKRTLWERSVHVPYLIVAPGVTTAGTKCDAPVDLMSIYPTLLELCALPKNPAISGEGRSVVPLLKNPDADWPYRAICTHRRGNHTVRSRHFRYIRYEDGSEELYDHRNDPNEWTNLLHESPSGGHRKIADQLAADLPKVEAKTGLDYYRGNVLMRLDQGTYHWRPKSEVADDPRYQNANKIKSRAWNASAQLKEEKR